MILDLFALAAGTTPPEPSGGMGATTLIVAALGAGGFGAILAAVITGLFSKKKLGAEATEIITKAAAGVVTNMQAELDRQVKRNGTLIAEHRAQVTGLIASHAEEIDEFRRTLTMHAAWDAIVRVKMAEHGVDLPPAPPLLPARRFDHPDELDD